MSAIEDHDFGNPAEYTHYLRAEWDLFARDEARQTALRNATGGLTIRRVLDLGCGAAQQLRPFVSDPAVLGVGVDVAPLAPRAARALFAAACPDSRVVFVRAAAERLPFADASFDVIVCRLALPYTDNARTIGEIARVLAPGGAVLLTFHHVRFYLTELRQALQTLKPRAVLHACRVLAAGAVYHATGRQPRGRLTGGETFQTFWLLRRELRHHGLNIQRTLEDSVAAAPSLLIRAAARG